ncbi:MAG: GatB/YqeY domain-containing protein [Burkholderiales bacterium]|jgi:hypothetical protein|nr:GatB/YqeY domain-containing protein [Burkholderiales bacterium]
MSDLKTRIQDDVKTAMRARDSVRLAALRLLTAAIKQREVDDQRTLADADVLTVIDKMLKQRRDSIAQFDAAGRTDLADAERFEVGVLTAYMPAGLTADEIAAAVAAAVTESGAAGPQDMGKVMALLKPRLAGRADMSQVSQAVKAKLAAV